MVRSPHVGVGLGVWRETPVLRRNTFWYSKGGFKLLRFWVATNLN